MSGQETPASNGLPDKDEVPGQELEELERQRAERLDPANRPPNSEVDNTHRTFDPGSGMFTDNPDYDPNHRPFAKPGETPPPRTEPRPPRFGAHAFRPGAAQGLPGRQDQQGY